MNDEDMVLVKMSRESWRRVQLCVADHGLFSLRCIIKHVKLVDVPEPVAWRWHWTAGDEPDVWAYREDEPKPNPHTVVEPLYAALK